MRRTVTYTLTDDAFKDINTLSKELDVPKSTIIDCLIQMANNDDWMKEQVLIHVRAKLEEVNQ